MIKKFNCNKKYVAFRIVIFSLLTIALIYLLYISQKNNIRALLSIQALYSYPFELYSFLFGLFCLLPATLLSISHLIKNIKILIRPILIIEEKGITYRNEFFPEDEIVGLIHNLQIIPSKNTIQNLKINHVIWLTQKDSDELVYVVGINCKYIDADFEDIRIAIEYQPFGDKLELDIIKEDD